MVQKIIFQLLVYTKPEWAIWLPQIILQSHYKNRIPFPVLV